jgi:hypothetical protein
VAAAFAVLAFAGPASSAVSVAIEPALQHVPLGAEFDLVITVPAGGSDFNAFDAVISHDPTMLTLVPLSPLSLQQGSLMTDSCATTFHVFRQGASLDTVTLALLCSQTSVTGPGEIYRLRFQATSPVPQVTTVYFYGQPKFFDAGVEVTPVVTNFATVGLGTPTGVGDPRASLSGPRVRAVPNPAFGTSVLRVEASEAGEQELMILDIHGRAVRRLERGIFDGVSRTVTWDGLSDSGGRMPPGVYLVVLRTPAHTVQTRLVLLGDSR